MGEQLEAFIISPKNLPVFSSFTKKSIDRNNTALRGASFSDPLEPKG
jgi:hypothetical protein